MEQKNSDVVKMLSPKDILNRYVTATKITVYLVNAKGLWESQYYCLVSTENAESSLRTILNFFEKQAKDNNKKLHVDRMNDSCFKLTIEGETEYTIQIFVGYAIITNTEFNEAKTEHSVEKMLESMMA